MTNRSIDRFDRLLNFLRRLHDAKIPHSLADYREDAVSVIAHAPGEYWEVDFLADGDVDIERYRSDGVIEEESALERLFALWVDDESTTPTAGTRDAAVSGK